VLPLAVGDHIDHRITRQAGLDALASGAHPVAFYEDLPYAGMEQFAETLQSHVDSTGLDLQPVFPEPEPGDVEARVRRKARMVECYDSQVDSLAVRQIAEFSRRYEGRERLWTNPAWRAPSLGQA